MMEENGKQLRQPDVGKIVPQATGSGNKCKYCELPMPRLARVCIHCNRDQRWYLNYFRRGDLLLLIFVLVSLALVYFSYENYLELKEERVKAGEALQLALSTEDIVKKAHQELEKLKLSGEEGRREVDRITSLVKEAEGKLSAMEILAKEARQKELEKLKLSGEEGRREVDRITSLVKEAEGKLSAVEILAKEARQKADRLQYYDIAHYNAIGNKSVKVAAIPLVATPINDWSELFVIRSKGKIGFDCSPEAVDACKAVIEKMPLYPFSYYFLAKCFKEQKNPLWREYALKAQRILKETTAFPLHQRDHDLAFKEIGELLKE